MTGPVEKIALIVAGGAGTGDQEGDCDGIGVPTIRHCR